MFRLPNALQHRERQERTPGLRAWAQEKVVEANLLKDNQISKEFEMPSEWAIGRDKDHVAVFDKDTHLLSLINIASNTVEWSLTDPMLNATYKLVVGNGIILAPECLHVFKDEQKVQIYKNGTRVGQFIANIFDPFSNETSLHIINNRIFSLSYTGEKLCEWDITGKLIRTEALSSVWPRFVASDRYFVICRSYSLAASIRLNVFDVTSNQMKTFHFEGEVASKVDRVTLINDVIVFNAYQNHIYQNQLVGHRVKQDLIFMDVKTGEKLDQFELPIVHEVLDIQGNDHYIALRLKSNDDKGQVYIFDRSTRTCFHATPTHRESFIIDIALQNHVLIVLTGTLDIQARYTINLRNHTMLPPARFETGISFHPTFKQYSHHLFAHAQRNRQLVIEDFRNADDENALNKNAWTMRLPNNR